jgi:hypothetical protein
VRPYFNPCVFNRARKEVSLFVDIMRHVGVSDYVVKTVAENVMALEV